jgi:tripartite-type tricarboxylate transporter receptor subunit TctC
MNNAFAFSLLLGLSALLMPMGEADAAYPERPVTVVVPFPPGGTTDILARRFAAELGEAVHGTVVVENRPGAGGNIGAQSVARANPDGYTLLFSTAGPLSINQHLYADPGYDPVKSFAPVALFASVPIMLVSTPSAPFKTVPELIEYAKKNPGKISYGSQGNGTTSHLTMELLKSMLHLNMQHIPYRGSAPASADLMAGYVSVMFDNSPSTMPFVQSGKMRGLGIASKQRVDSMKELPAIAETVPGFSSQAWFGIVAPANTPNTVIEQLNKATNDMLSNKDFRAVLEKTGSQPLGGSVYDFITFRDAEIGKWGDIVKQAGVKLD